jgi:P27 family predicted phage terminase small subunit
MRQLEPMRVVTLADQQSLGFFADAISMFHEAEQDIDERGKNVPGRGGVPVRNPSFMVRKDERDFIYRMGGQFGLTPAARASLVAPPPPDDAGIEALLS